MNCRKLVVSQSILAACFFAVAPSSVGSVQASETGQSLQGQSSSPPTDPTPESYGAATDGYACGLVPDSTQMRLPLIIISIWCTTKTTQAAGFPVNFVFTSLPPGVKPMVMHYHGSGSDNGSRPRQPTCILPQVNPARCSLNLTAFYDMDVPGSYSVHAIIKLPGGAETATTPSVTFSVLPPS
jgi:hypothetical protein